MIRLEKFHVAAFALLMTGGSVFLPLVAEAREIPWLLRIKALLTYHQEMAAPLGNAYAHYFEQIDYPKNGSYRAASPFMLRPFGKLRAQHERSVEVVTRWVRVRSP